MNDLAPIGGIDGLPGFGDETASLPKVSMPRRDKAAIVVAALLNDGVELPLSEMPEENQAALTYAMAEMRMIDRDTLKSILEEFSEELERIGLAFPEGLSGALSALDGMISPHTAARLRRESGVLQWGDPWRRIAGLSTQALLPILENESPEVVAVVLSKLETKHAAELLSALPGDRARRISYAFSRTSQIKPEAVDRIGLALATQIELMPTPAFDDGPVKRVGDILNSSSAAARDTVLEGLDEEDADFAREVRKAIFTFNNISDRLDPRDVPKITREIEPVTLVKALAYAQNSDARSQKAVEFIFENMSSRIAEQLREEIEDLGKVKQAEGEQAMDEIVTIVRAMEEEGKIIFQSD